MRTRSLAAGLAAATLTLTACLPTVTDAPAGTAWHPATLTDDGNDRYTVAGDPTFTTVTAPLGNSSGNTRIALTTPDAPQSVDQAICTTITGSTTPGTQPGVVLRFDGTHAITVTRNVWGGAYTAVNVHQWDLTLPPDAGRFAYAGGWTLPGLGWSGPAAAYPWRLCASATGPTIAFKTWPLAREEPPAGDPCCTGSLPLAVWPGRAGLYAGHLPPGHTLAYTNTTWSGPMMHVHSSEDGRNTTVTYGYGSHSTMSDYDTSNTVDPDQDDTTEAPAEPTQDEAETFDPEVEVDPLTDAEDDPAA